MKKTVLFSLVIILTVVCNFNLIFAASDAKLQEKREKTGIEKVTDIYIEEGRLIIKGILEAKAAGEVSAALHRSNNSFLDSYDGSAYSVCKGKEFEIFFNMSSLNLDEQGNGAYYAVMADTGNVEISVENLLNVGYKVNFEIKENKVQLGWLGQETSLERPGLEVDTTTGEALSINDINGHWAEKDIRSLIEKGALTGYRDGTFRPESKITRAEFAQIVKNAFQIEKVKEITLFADVSKEAWYYEAVAALYEKQIVSGVGESLFAPDENISREQVAVILSKTAAAIRMDLAIKREYIPFIDNAGISDYAKDAVKTMYQAEIIGGVKDVESGAYRFLPQHGATRAEVATIINQLLSQNINQ